MQELADVVAVLALPVVACPGYAVGKTAGTVCDQTLVNSLQQLGRLTPGKFQGALHELGITARQPSMPTNTHNSSLYLINLQCYHYKALAIRLKKVF